MSNCSTPSNTQGPDMYIIQGKTHQKKFRVVVDGTTYDPAELDTAVFRIKSGAPDGTTLLSLTLADGDITVSGNDILVNFTPAQSASVAAGRHWYGIELVFNSVYAGYCPPYPPGRIDVVQEVVT